MMMDDPTRAEIEEIINKSRNGKAPGKDGIRMKMFMKICTTLGYIVSLIL